MCSKGRQQRERASLAEALPVVVLRNNTIWSSLNSLFTVWLRMCSKGRQQGDSVSLKEAPPVVVLRNGQGVEVHVTSQGAAIQRVLLPDKTGALSDVVLGFDDTNAYVVSTVCQLQFTCRILLPCLTRQTPV